MKLNPIKFSFALFLLLASQLTQAGDWPQWRGQNRDGKSTDTGLLRTWPDNGPQLQWKSDGLGRGYAGVSVVGALLYTMGDKTDGNYLMALNADGGKPVWSVKVGKVGAPGSGNFAGPRCQPTVSGGFVFTVDQWGELVCANAADGQELWRKNYEKDFGAKRPEWGFAESPLVDGNQVIFTPGGSQGAIVALNKKTGELLWQTKGFTDEAHYSSVVTAEIGGVHQFVQLTMASVAGVSPQDGSLLWKAARKGKVAVIPTPVVEGDLVYVTSGYDAGCNLFKVTAAAGKFTSEQVYTNKAVANHHGGMVKLGDHLYGHSDAKGLVCQNFKTGEIVWAEKEKVKKGSVSIADGRLYYREEVSGNVILIEPSPAGYTEKGRLVQPDRVKENAWPHPVIANGKLYLRDQDSLFCYDVKGK